MPAVAVLPAVAELESLGVGVGDGLVEVDVVGDVGVPVLELELSEVGVDTAGTAGTGGELSDVDLQVEVLAFDFLLDFLVLQVDVEGDGLPLLLPLL